MTTCKIRTRRFDRLVLELTALGHLSAAEWLRSTSEASRGFVSLPVPMNRNLATMLGPGISWWWRADGPLSEEIWKKKQAAVKSFKAALFQLGEATTRQMLEFATK